MILWITFVLLAYLLGSVPFGHVVSKHLYGIDIRSVGSGNIGATNVYRNLGWGAAILTAAGDLGKGVAAIALAKASGSGTGWAALVGLAVTLGHCYPIFLRFRGGKGVSTTVAVLLALSPSLFLVFIVAWLIILLAQGRMSLASLGAAAASPVMASLMPQPQPGMIFFTWAAAILIFVRHRENIDRLMNGAEKQIVKPIGLFGNRG